MSTLRLFLIPILCVFAFGASAHAQGTTRVSVDSNGQLSNAGSASSAVTPEGRFVVFVSEADNLVASDTNGLQDVFVHDPPKGVYDTSQRGLGGARSQWRVRSPVDFG